MRQQIVFKKKIKESLESKGLKVTKEENSKIKDGFKVWWFDDTEEFKFYFDRLRNEIDIKQLKY